MSLICDYFVAGSDEEAAATAGWPGGPGTPPAGRRGLFRRAAETGGAPLPTEALPGLDPVVMLGTLEALLTGGSADDLVAANADAQVNEEAAAVLVFRLSDTLTGALAGAPAERLRQVADPWSRTEELAGDGDPAVLAEALQRLAQLAQQARSTGGRLYCWTSP